MSTYDTIYDFCKANRVEVTMGQNGIYNCYINYQEGDRPWGNGTNILDAIDNGVVTYLRNQSSHRSYHPQQPRKQQEAQIYQPTNVQPLPPDKLAHYLSFEGRIFWYWFARKYKKDHIITEYEQHAQDTHPSLLNTIRFIVDKAANTIENINTLLYEKIPAIHNIWIQAIVYYESFAAEKYENNKTIMDLVEKTSAQDREAFHRIQEQIAKIDEEIQTI